MQICGRAAAISAGEVILYTAKNEVPERFQKYYF
jgi:hypothetical protein